MNVLRTMTVMLALAAATPSVGQVPDLGPWDGVWLKGKAKVQGSSFRVNAPGVGKDRGSASIYLQLHVDPLATPPLTADLYVREDVWERNTIPLLYLAGTTEDLAVYFNEVPASPTPVTEAKLHVAYALRLRGKVADGRVAKGSVKSLGGYFIEIDDVPGSEERFAGKLSLKGKVTTKVPPDLPIP